RQPDAVAKDVRRRIVSPRIAEEIFGVVLNQDSPAPDNAATLKRRQEIREERMRESKTFSGATSSLSDAVRRSTAWRQILKFHEHLAIATNGQNEAIRRSRCGHLILQQ